jgi:Arc/MetJ-type ribon-helix-helix transcriptional regulator
MNTGRYASEDEVLRDALRALKWRDDEIAAIQEGLSDMEAGRVRPLREFDREFRERNKIPEDA